MLFFSFCTSSVDSEINSEDLLKESTTTTITKSEDSVLDGEIENNLLINNIEEAQKGIVRIVT